jgi:hypothetical protein
VPLLDDICTYLDNASSQFKMLSGSTGNLVKSALLDHTPAPDTLTALYETGGAAPAWVFGSTSPAYETAGLQVICRSSAYPTAHDRAFTAYRILGGIRNQRLPLSSQSSNCLYLDCNPDQPPFSLGTDGNNRWLVSVNFTVRKERQS